MKQINEQLIQFIADSSSTYHAVLAAQKILESKGFLQLDMQHPWKLTSGGSYYTIPYSSTLFAFTIGPKSKKLPVIRAAAAHTDHPGFHIKPNPEITEKNYLKINTESYGGLIVNTWLDRPLSVAGKVALKSSHVFQPEIQFVDLKKPILTIPNLAIHLNKEMNKGVELNKQTDILPILGTLSDSLHKEHFFMDMLSRELSVKPEDILDFDLFLYNAEPGCTLGMNDDFLSCPRLDNLTSAFALLSGISQAPITEGIHLIALYDNEEIGSRSKQGADSFLTTMLLEKIFYGLGYEKTFLYESILNSILLSVDVAHALHPNYISKHDITNFAGLNDGIVLKIDSNQKYAYDTEAIAMVQQLCDAKNIKYQKFVNRSDGTSGSTLGSIASAWMPMKTVDLGLPILAMHSARELMGSQDQEQLNLLMTEFFSAS